MADANTGNASFQGELDSMYILPERNSWPDVKNRFFTKSGFEASILEVSVPTRFQNIAEAMLPYLRKVLSEQYVIQKCSDQLGMTPSQTSPLLKEHLLPPAGAITNEIQKAIDVFTKDDV
ncbi:MAG: hypothetical protein IPG32_07545 [Saprospirales bacterium]|nr:hypothetical protein [Saprospirales bacterium]